MFLTVLYPMHDISASRGVVSTEDFDDTRVAFTVAVRANSDGVLPSVFAALFAR